MNQFATDLVNHLNNLDTDRHEFDMDVGWACIRGHAGHLTGCLVSNDGLAELLGIDSYAASRLIYSWPKGTTYDPKAAAKRIQAECDLAEQPAQPLTFEDGITDAEVEELVEV